jgi:hypothetical protein
MLKLRGIIEAGLDPIITFKVYMNAECIKQLKCEAQAQGLALAYVQPGRRGSAVGQSFSPTRSFSIVSLSPRTKK